VARKQNRGINGSAHDDTHAHISATMQATTTSHVHSTPTSGFVLVNI